MAFITIFSETGFPHAGVYLEFSTGGHEWIGFFPGPEPLDHGKIKTHNCEAAIAHYVRYPIADSRLLKARTDITTKYWSKVYVFGVCDCVSFVRDLMEECGFDVFWRPSMLPSGLVDTLVKSVSGYTHHDVRPFPWHTAALLGKWRVKVSKWTWIYEFFSDGRVAWLDPNNNQSGSGKWKLTDKSVATTWDGSSTKEQWELPIEPKLTIGKCTMQEGRFPLSATKI